MIYEPFEIRGDRVIVIYSRNLGRNWAWCWLSAWYLWNLLSTSEYIIATTSVNIWID